jgi:uncharacterized protein YdeI (YjbR/CyaY-like superfamily)
MGTRDPRVDAYIANAAEFARPILAHLRQVVHAACPEVEETLKWRMPTFMYRGMLCGMAAFKRHATFGFWKGGLVVGEDGTSADAMGQFGRLTRVADLPSKRALTALVKQAMKLNEAGIKQPRAVKHPKPKLVEPDDLVAALDRSRKARTTYAALSPSHRREYVEWLTEAKGEATRQRRLATAIEWLAEGKTRNWKYERC